MDDAPLSAAVPVCINQECTTTTIKRRNTFHEVPRLKCNNINIRPVVHFFTPSLKPARVPARLSSPPPLRPLASPLLRHVSASVRNFTNNSFVDNASISVPALSSRFTASPAANVNAKASSDEKAPAKPILFQSVWLKQSPLLRCAASPRLGAIAPAPWLKGATQAAVLQGCVPPVLMKSPPLTRTSPKLNATNLGSLEDVFLLPQAATEGMEERWGSVGSLETGDVESVEDYGNNLTENKPEAAVLSPMGTSWIKATKRFFFEDSFTIWFDGLVTRGKKQTNAKQYENALHEIGSFSSVQEFWRFWNAMDLVGMTKGSSLSVFKNPIKPMWEDKENTHGARYILKIVNEKQASENFTDIVLSLVGAIFDCHEQLCGVALASKGTFYTLQIWTKSASDDLFSKLQLEIKSLLGADYPENDIAWKAHNGSNQKNGAKGGGRQNAVQPAAMHYNAYQQWGMYPHGYAQAYSQYCYWQGG
eukprot:GEMP01008687.1.p1 GENE.GEMP01008687.1~~GEMP01008687.1.p1  ORF type:complete len:477 (+),score=87.79 GEMP01008687.1:149-1579(+)